MAQPQEEAPTSMSVIPYDSNRQVVLRHADSIVVYDPASRQMVLGNANQELDTQRVAECPTCRRPWQKAQAHLHQEVEDEPHPVAQPGFINNDYFRMLHQSLPGSAEPSAPPSPRRQIVQPVRSNIEPPDVAPPPNAEFVGTSPAPPSRAHGISSTAFAPKYFEKFFTVEKELGRGGRGVVLLVKHVLDGVSLGYFACKRVPIGDDHAWLEKVLVEVQLLQTLSHQNLVSYRHVWLEDFKLSNFSPSVPCAFILQQYCNGGDVHNYICGSAQASTTTQDLKDSLRRRSKGESELPKKVHDPRKLHLDEIYSFFRDITAGLQFLHLNGFIHRDLKPSNCLLHTIGHETRVLVSDFGEVQYESVVRKSSGATGTISYCAPEVLRRVVPGGPYGNFTFKSDIFSLGMILYFLCFATSPYQHADVLHEEREDVETLRAEIIEWEGFDDVRKLRPELPEKLYAFLKRLLSVNPDRRPTADEVNNSIRTGASLEERPHPIRRNSVSPEELTPGHRIVRIESPAPGTSSTRVSSSNSAQASALARAILPPRRRRPRSRSRERPVIHTSLRPAPELDSDHDAQDNHVKKQDMILHPKVSSPRDELHHDFPPRSPLLLRPASIPPTRRSRLGNLLQLPSTSYILRILILVMKLLSLLQPCASKGINPLIVYPMMLLAIIEFTLPRYQLLGGTLALVTHILVLATAVRLNMLCAASAWEEV